MKATVKFSLSAAGQKDALTKSLPATSEQSIEIDVESRDLQYFAVATNGSLSLDLHRQASSALSGYREEFASLYLDTYPTQESILTFLRERETLRAAALAERRAEQKTQEDNKQRKIDDALAAFAALTADQQDALFASSNYVTVNNICLCTEHAPIRDAYKRVLAHRAAQTAAKERRAKLPPAPPQRAVTLREDGTCQFTCPACSLEKSWAKHVTAFNPLAKGGYRYEGAWLECGNKYPLAPGEIIAVGGKEWAGSRKHGEWVTDLDLYIVTTVALLECNEEYFPLSAAERIERKLTKAAEEAADKIAKFDAAAADPEFAADLPLIAERRAAWLALKNACEQALAGGAGDSKISDVDSAALAIVAAGFKMLAKEHHPDAGGSAETMVLINAAHKQLRELLKLAKEAK